MKQFLLPDYFNGEYEFLLNGKDTHYLKNVLRVKVGTELQCTDVSGRAWRGIISRYDADGCLLTLFQGDGNERGDRGTAPSIILYQGLIRGKNMDLIVRQAVEAGVSAVVPVEAEYSQIRLKDYKNEKPERWQRIIREAMQQSGSSIFTEIAPMVRIDDISPVGEGEVGLFFHQCPLENKTLHQYLSHEVNKVYIFIGPEGGLSEQDINILEKKGFVPVLLGDNILRAETAAIYAVAAVNMLLLERNTWNAV